MPTRPRANELATGSAPDLASPEPAIKLGVGEAAPSPPPDKAAPFDPMYVAGNALGEMSLYLNLGYWEPTDTHFDQGFERLVRKTVELAALGPEDQVLDVGCGLGDQDFWISRHLSPARLVALNLSRAQLDLCERRRPADLRGLEFVQGDALKLPFANASFDVVLAIEAAHHFADKDTFFREAFRVLKPGGRLVMADLLGRDRIPEWDERLKLVLTLPALARLYRLPMKNLWNGPSRLIRSLQETGFEQVMCQSIYQHVIPPFLQRLANHVRSARFREGSGRSFYLWSRLGGALIERLGIENLPYDYVLVRADKLTL